MEHINEQLMTFIENNILPTYKNNDPGHRIEHIKYVTERSIRFASQFPNINLNMVYTIASFHDIAHYIDKNKHNILSAQIFYKNEGMKVFFNSEQRIIIKEAIEDHRASLEYEPRSDYGKIVSSADRTIDIATALKRANYYFVSHNLNTNLFQTIKYVYDYIEKKYGLNGYANNYVIDNDYDCFKKEVQEILNDKQKFVTKYIQVNEILRIKDEAKEDLFLRDNVFNGNHDYYEKLLKLHAQKMELQKLQALCSLSKAFVIEFCGTPRTGKTTIIHKMADFFVKGGFTVSVIEEITPAKCNYQGTKSETDNINLENSNIAVTEEVYKQLQEGIESGKEIILIDRALYDRQIWNDIEYGNGIISETQYVKTRDRCNQISKGTIDFLVITYAETFTSLRRDYFSNLALEKRRYLNQDNIEEYNNCLKALNTSFSPDATDLFFIDTTLMSVADVSTEIASQILLALRGKYIECLVQKYNAYSAF